MMDYGAVGGPQLGHLHPFVFGEPGGQHDVLIFNFTSGREDITTPWGEATTQEMCFNFLYVTPIPMYLGQPISVCNIISTTLDGGCQ